MICSEEKRENDAILTCWRPEGKLASFSVYTNSALTPPSTALTPPPHGLSPPPNQHLFVINTAECSTADNAEHLRSGKQNPLGLRRSEQEGDRGSQTVCEIDRQTEIWMGYKAPTLSPEAPSELGLWQNHFACPPTHVNKRSSIAPSCIHIYPCSLLFWDPEFWGKKK